MSEILSRKRKSGDDKTKKSNSHADQLTRLQETDPSFYNFLKNENPDLLNFEDLDENLEEDTSEIKTESKIKKNKTKIAKESKKDESDKVKQNEPKLEIILTLENIECWKKGLKENNKKCAKECIYALSDIVFEHFGGNEIAHEQKFSKKLTKTRQGFKAKAKKQDKNAPKINRSNLYKTQDWIVINSLIEINANDIPNFLKIELSIPEEENKKYHAHLDENWTRSKSIVFLYISSILQICSSEKHSIQILELFDSFKSIFSLFFSFSSHSKSLINILINFLSNQDEHLRTLSSQLINEFVQYSPHFYTFTFKKIINNYYANCKRNIYDDENILKFLTKNIIDYIAIDFSCAYQEIYENLRNLALLLRDAISLQTKKAYVEFYQWKVLGCLELWSSCLHFYENNAEIKSLIFPLVEVTFAILRLTENIIYFPAHLHLLRSLTKLLSREIYIPLTPYLLKILLSKELNNVKVTTTSKPPILKFMTHIPTSLYNTKIMNSAVFDEAYDILLEVFSKLSECVSFPETTYIPIRWIRNSVKDVSNIIHQKQLKMFISKVEETAKIVESKRRKVDFSPLDLDRIRPWEEENLNLSKSKNSTPLSEYFKQWRANRSQLLEQMILAHKNQDDKEEKE